MAMAMNGRFACAALLAGLALCAGGMVRGADGAAQGEARVGAAVVDDDDGGGVRVHEVTSPYQRGTTEIRVLLPDALDKARRYPVVYVLPVEAGRERRYGDGLEEVRRRDLANEHGAIFVAPTFTDLAWYADHPTDEALRQETYFLDVVVPAVDARYPTVATKEGRLLLGFSKSGWGAWSLLLRRPDLFGRAAAWDAPLELERSGPYGSGAIFGTQENFAKYELGPRLEARAELLKGAPRMGFTRRCTRNWNVSGSRTSIRTVRRGYTRGRAVG